MKTLTLVLAVSIPFALGVAGCRKAPARMAGKISQAGAPPPNVTCDYWGCRPNTCSNGLKNINESDVDCGGPCQPCETGEHCKTNEDCISLTCDFDAGLCLTLDYHGRCPNTCWRYLRCPTGYGYVRDQDHGYGCRSLATLQADGMFTVNACPNREGDPCHGLFEPGNDCCKNDKFIGGFAQYVCAGIGPPGYSGLCELDCGPSFQGPFVESDCEFYGQ